MSSIDYSPLGKAIGRLKEGLDALKREPENTLYRDAVIQRFEFTYGLCATLLERYLARTSLVPVESKMTFPTLIRTASERGLLREDGTHGTSSERRAISPATYITRTPRGRWSIRFPHSRERPSFFTRSS